MGRDKEDRHPVALPRWVGGGLSVGSGEGHRSWGARSHGAWESQRGGAMGGPGGGRGRGTAGVGGATTRGRGGRRGGRREREVCEGGWRAKGVAAQMGNCELSPTLAAQTQHSTPICRVPHSCWTRSNRKKDNASRWSILCTSAARHCSTSPPLHFRATPRVVRAPDM